jgi:hypothetical protein
MQDGNFTSFSDGKHVGMFPAGEDSSYRDANIGWQTMGRRGYQSH